jgi:hypothetical protein
MKTREEGRPPRKSQAPSTSPSSITKTGPRLHSSTASAICRDSSFSSPESLRELLSGPADWLALAGFIVILTVFVLALGWVYSVMIVVAS